MCVFLRESGRFLRLTDSKKHVACAITMFLMKPNIQFLQIPHEWIGCGKDKIAFHKSWVYVAPPPPRPQYNTKFVTKPEIPNHITIPTLSVLEYIKYF